MAPARESRAGWSRPSPGVLAIALSSRLILVLLIGILGLATWAVWSFVGEEEEAGLVGGAEVGATSGPGRVARDAGESEHETGLETGAIAPSARDFLLVGRVLDEDGRPIAGAEIRAGRRRCVVGAEGAAFVAVAELDEESAVTTRSDDEGAFTFRELPRTEGDAGLVVATAGGYRPAALAGLVFADGGRCEIELRLRRGRRLELRLRALPDGAPVADAAIELAPMGHEEGDALLARWLVVRARSDERGTVSSDGLAARRYRLRVRAPGFLDPRERMLGPDESLVEIGLQRAGIVFGRIVAARSGRDAELFEVSARDLAERGAGAVDVLVGEEAEAAVGVSASPAFFAVVRASSPDLEIAVAAEGLARGSFELPALEPGERREVLLELPAAAVLRGSARSHDGRPVVGAELRAVSEGDDDDALADEAEIALMGGDLSRLDPRGPRPRFRPAAEIVATSDEAGRFALEGLAAGRYRLLAGHRDHREPESLEVRIEEGAEQSGLVITFRAAGAVAGRIIDMRGRGIAGVEVQLARRAGSGAAAEQAALGELLFDESAGEALSDGEGRFLITGIEPGPHRLTAIVGLRRLRADLEVRADQVAEIELRLGDER